MKQIINKSGYTIRIPSSEKYIGTNFVNKWDPNLFWVSELEMIYLWNTKRGPEDFIKRVQRNIEFSKNRYNNVNNRSYYASNIARLDKIAEQLLNLEIVKVEIEIVKDSSIKIIQSTPSMFIKSSFGVK